MIDAPVGDRSRWQPDWPDVKEHFIPLGIASVVREGADATVHELRPALAVMRAGGRSDSRGDGLRVRGDRPAQYFPYDWKTISGSVQKTGRVLIVNEDTEVTNFGEHLLRRIVEEHFYDLLVRPRCSLANTCRASG